MSISVLNEITDELNDFSKKYFELLTFKFPELKSLVRIDTTEGVKEGSFIVELRSPSENHAEGLSIFTDNDEITVGFDYYHCHFGLWTGDTEEQSFQKANKFIKKVICDKAVAVSWFKDDEALGGTCISPREDLVPRQGSSISSYNRIRARSWTGIHDQDIEV